AALLLLVAFVAGRYTSRNEAAATPSDASSRAADSESAPSARRVSTAAPPASVRLERMKDDERKLQARVDAERTKENPQRTNEGRRLLEGALRDADQELSSDGAPPSPTGHIEEFACYATICRGKSNHVNDDAFRAFSKFAFVGGEHRYPGWVAVTAVERADDGTRAALFYLGLGPTPAK